MAMQSLARSYERQGVRYVVIGIWNTAFAYGVFVLTNFMFVPPLTNVGGLFLASSIGILQSYTTQRFFVWRSHEAVKKELGKFILVGACQIAANAILLYTFVDVLGFPIYLTQFVITGLLILMTYFVLKWWTFGPARNNLEVEGEGFDH